MLEVPAAAEKPHELGNHQYGKKAVGTGLGGGPDYENLNETTSTRPRAVTGTSDPLMPEVPMTYTRAVTGTSGPLVPEVPMAYTRAVTGIGKPASAG